MIGGENMTDTQKPNDVAPANNAAQPIAEAQQVQQPVVTPAPVVSTENDRTANQFEKLLESNRQLYEANQLLRTELQQRREATQQFKPVQLPPIQQQPIPQEINPVDFIEVDPISGERVINEVKLNARISELNDRASRAEEAVTRYVESSEQREIERQNREAFTAYPELNPADPKHDMVFHNQTRAVIYDSVLNPQDYGGRPLNFKDAADYVRAQQAHLVGGGQQAPQVPAGPTTQEQQLAAQELKQQAAASPTGETQTQRPTIADGQELESLRLKTRLGDPTALMTRLANVDHVIKKEEEAS